jgi:aldose 1-epimerase
VGTNSITRTAFGTTKSGEAVTAFTLTSSTGATATILDWGGTIQSLKVPDKSGALGDVTLGFDNIEQYESQSPYFGALIGRVANRIAKGQFTLNGKTYELAINNGPNHLHGGLKGYDKRIWNARPIELADAAALELSLTDRDGTEHYPGTVPVKVTYTLRQNTLRLDYKATTDKPTPINLTNHAYFNLRDAGASDILNHVLQIEADEYTPVDETLIPTGRIAKVAGTAIDFTSPKPIGRDLTAMGGDPPGYDHNLVLRVQDGTFAHAATVEEPVTGRRMEVWTNQPGVQLYTGNFLDGTVRGKAGVTYKQHHAFCLETQHFPDAVHHPQFPTIILAPEQVYQYATEFRFSA